MVKKLSIFACFIIVSLSFLSCSKISNITDEIINNPPNPIEEEKYYNFYTGIECPKEELNNFAFMTIIENSSAARPQSGISYADILFETSAEGGIPRFLALFSSNLPSVIGPVRSIRPYFIDIVKEFNIPVAHCGGSAEALTTIDNDSSIISINEITQGSYFWRDSSRKAPHNLYTSSDNIKKYVDSKNINITKSQFASFDENFFDNSNLQPASNIKLLINKTYNTSYEYRDNLYYKFMNSEKAIDSINNSQINFSNIVVQKTPITLSNDNSHLNIPIVGEGEGIVFSKGKMINITWKRDSLNSKVTLLDKYGSIVPLSPGKTMWNIVDTKSKIEIT